MATLLPIACPVFRKSSRCNNQQSQNLHRQHTRLLKEIRRSKRSKVASSKSKTVNKFLSLNFKQFFLIFNLVAKIINYLMVMKAETLLADMQYSVSIRVLKSLGKSACRICRAIESTSKMEYIQDKIIKYLHRK